VLHAVVRRDEPLAAGGGAVAGFRDRTTALLASSWSSSATPRPIRERPKRRFARSTGSPPTEARLTDLLVRGRTVKSAARTHLKRVFSKTGTGRQTDLGKLCLQSVATVSSQGD